MKATKELIGEVLRKRIAACSKEELDAVLRLIGFTVKEYRSSDIKGRKGQKQTSFELHHQYYYCMRISGDTDVKAYSYHNEYLQENGYSIPTENVSELIAIMVNMWVPRLPFNFEGPQYDENRDYEYDSVEEMQTLLGYLQEEMDAMNSPEKEDKPSMDLPVEVTKKQIKDVLPTMVEELDQRKMAIYIEAVNKFLSDAEQITGVQSEGHAGIFGSDKGRVLPWDEFLECEIAVGNIQL